MVGKVLHEAQELYYTEHGTYTNNVNEMDISIDLSDFRIKWSGWVIELSHKKAPLFHYVWYPRHNYRSGPNMRLNNSRECRVYDTTDGHKILKQVCNEATGRPGANNGNYFWVSYFPRDPL